ncbi:replication protein [Delftia acidovorans]|uniref:Replication protein n=1 Tax=Chryseobacterium sp. B5 TaxID=2050562 RepID=A0A2G7T8A9_9FLAO|nr:replication protein [Delftia acidovorans]
MRDYAKAVPKMWHGKTFKALRKHPEGLVVALYLMTSPSSNMLGLYAQPVLYMAYETGLGEEGARKGLQQCIEAGYCSYDDESEFVWVHEMASYQIASELKGSDLRCKGIQKDYDALPDNPFLGEFFDRYAEAFHLHGRRGGEGAMQPPCKTLRSQEQEQEQEQEKKEPYGSVGSADDRPGENAPGKLGLPNCPVQDLVDLYHEVLPELPKVRLLNDGRRKAVGKLWKFVLTSKKSDNTPRAETAEQAVTWFREYFGRARDNDFLMGRGYRSGEHASWQCDLDFLLSEKGMKHVIEKTRTAA